MAQNQTTKNFLAGNKAWLERETYKTPYPMTELRKFGKGPEAPLMVGTYTYAPFSRIISPERLTHEYIQ